MIYLAAKGIKKCQRLKWLRCLDVLYVCPCLNLTQLTLFNRFNVISADCRAHRFLPRQNELNEDVFQVSL